MEFTSIIFYIFSLFTVFAAVSVIASRNPVHSVLWLIFAFFNAAGLFVLLGAEMLAMLLVIVYVGAVAVLFLFVVMMLNIKIPSSKREFQTYLPLGLLLAGILFVELTMVINNPSEKIEIAKAAEEAPKQAEQVVELKAEKPVVKEEKSKKEDAKKKDKKSGKKDKAAKAEKVAEPEKKEDSKKSDAVVAAIEDKTEKPTDVTVNVEPEKTEENVEKTEKVTNAQAIGRVLYTDYVLYFEACSLILLVAMIGAIVLTLRHREGVRRQKTSVQNARTKSIDIVKVEFGKGVE